MATRRNARARRRRIGIPIAIATLFAEVFVLRQRGYAFGGKVIVRCRDGHLFATIWVPGVSFKSLRLVWWRFQRCPVGSHWSFVTPVAESELTEAERLQARATEDIRLP